MKKWLALSVFLLLVVASGMYYYYYQYKKVPQNEPTLVYNNESGNWENVPNLPRINREEVVNNTNEDGFSNLSILRGYFDSYIEEKEEFSVKSLLPFTMGRQFEIINLKIPPSKIFYCVPSITIVPATGQEVETKRLTYPVKNNETLSIPGEKVINFDKLIKEANQNTYFFLQLTKDFDKENTNYIKKMIVVGLCD